jgi:hypothetical protein
MIEIEYELFTAGEQNKPVAWTRTDVYAPVVKEEVMLKHPELRQYYPVPLYYAPATKE